MIIRLLLKEADALGHRGDRFVPSFGLGGGRQSAGGGRMCSIVCASLLYCMCVCVFVNDGSKSLPLNFLKTEDFPKEKGTISPFPPVTLQEMISLVSFISSSPMMAIDLGQRGQRGNWLRNSSMVKEEGFPLDPPDWCCILHMDPSLHQGPLTFSLPLSNIILSTYGCSLPFWGEWGPMLTF